MNTGTIIRYGSLELPPAEAQKELTWTDRCPVAYWWPADVMAVGGRGWTHGALLYTLEINGCKPDGRYAQLELYPDGRNAWLPDQAVSPRWQLGSTVSVYEPEMRALMLERSPMLARMQHVANLPVYDARQLIAPAAADAHAA